LIHGGRLLRTLQYIAVRSAHMQETSASLRVDNVQGLISEEESK